MYLSDFCSFLLCTCGWERRGERRVERRGERRVERRGKRGAWSGAARGRGLECILYGYS